MNSESDLPESLILDATGARAVIETEVIQRLWSGNGSIIRVFLSGGAYDSVVVKCIKPNHANDHPRGWNTDASFERKLQSYEVEARWYREYANQCPAECAIPRFLADLECKDNESQDNENQDNRWIVLEDLDRVFPARREELTVDEARICVRWLAHFHGYFFANAGAGLWPIGTYWHLATRQDEFIAMEQGPLKRAASELDRRLNDCSYQTLVHGDAKVANFCFSNEEDRVAAVDFQYVGRGCGIKDFVYFLGSAMNERSCEEHSESLLGDYFSVLTSLLPDALAKPVENEWRELYPVAWADFHRFLSGWMPEHKKINRYTQNMTRTALEMLADDF